MRLNIDNFRPTKVDKANYYYILVNIGLSAFSFLRSFVFMRFLDLKELGIISLVQTIIMFMGLMQIGLMNGGYRIISLGKQEDQEKTNNSIYSYISVLLPICLVICLLFKRFNIITELSPSLLFLSIIFGVLTLLHNWYNNVLIGEQKLSEVNLVNITSYTASLMLLPLACYYGFWGGIIVIIIQPLSYVIISLCRNRELLPTKFYLKFEYIRYILSFGFIPFLGGIFLSIYMQVERWSITEVLGVEALGGFYLVFLYVSLYQLVPASLNSIFFPKGVKAYSEKRFNDFSTIIRYYVLVLLFYGVVIFLITFFFLEPFVQFVFPKHIPGVELVYIILPGLILQSLSEPIGLILNSSVILRPMLIVNLLNLIFCIILVSIFIFAESFSLRGVAFIRMLSGCFMFGAYLLVYWIIRRRLYV